MPAPQESGNPTRHTAEAPHAESNRVFPSCPFLSERNASWMSAEPGARCGPDPATAPAPRRNQCHFSLYFAADFAASNSNRICYGNYTATRLAARALRAEARGFHRFARVYAPGQSGKVAAMRRALLFVSCALLASSAPLHGQSGTKNGEWPTYGGDLGHTRYAPLDQITGANFNTLQIAWRFKTDPLGPPPEFQFESTPLMVKGIVYTTAGSRRAVVALDGATGEMLWMHSENEGAPGAPPPPQLSRPGLAYWSDGRDDRILYVTPGYRLIALNAKTGVPVTSFGASGVVDLKLDDDQNIDLITGEIGLHATPIVAKDVVIVGAAHKTGGNPKSRPNEKSYIPR